MPYAPNTDYDPRLLQQGFRDLGAGLGKLKQLKEENEFYAQRGEDFARMADPTTGQPLLDAATAEKYAKGSLSQKKAIFADTMFKYTSGLKQQETGLEGRRVAVAEQNAKLGQDTLEARKRYGVTNLPDGRALLTNEGTGQAHMLGGTAAQPDGTIAKDEAGNEMGVWQGGKLIKDTLAKQWTTTGEVLVNSRTKKIVKPGTDLPQGGANTPGGTGGPNNNALLPSNGPVQVKTKAERDALPVGTRYIGPDGRTWTRK